ncbi:MAG: hypothetical protein WC472_01215 [Candidatus Paceibacterota bacterium]
MKFLELSSLKKYFIFIGILLLISPLITFAAGLEDLYQVGATISGILGGGWAGEIANGLVGGIIASASTVSLAMMQITLDFLNWTASGDFVQAGMMSSIDNPMIAAGWGAMRNLANILLIFGLVAIAISIMVGYEETKAKKMLIQFVITALLINFTPVLCGVFIDVANIIMASFLKGGVSPAMISAIQNAKNVNDVESLPSMILLFIFSIFASIFYILYGLLFMVRYIYLWWLIVLSPIALASRVFPSNEIIGEILPAQCQWNTWKKDFLNWVFIGVPAAFSIYLSETMMAAIVANPDVVTSSPSGYLGGAFSLIFSYFVAMAVMVMGFFMTVSKGGDTGSKLKGVASSIGRGAWSRTGGKVTDYAKDQTVGRMDRFGRGIAEGFSEGTATARSKAAGEGNKAGYLTQIRSGLTGSVRRAKESQIGDTDKKRNADKTVSDKLEAEYAEKVKNYTKIEQDAVLAKTDSSDKTKYEQNAIVNDRITKGKATESDLNFAFINANGTKKTKNAAAIELAKRGEVKDNHLKDIFDNPQNYDYSAKNSVIQSMIDSGNLEEDKVNDILSRPNDFDAKIRSAMVQSLIKEKSIKESYIETIKHDLSSVDAKTKGELMAFMPEIIPELDSANRNGRTDEEMITDAVKKMLPKQQNMINPESVAKNGAILAGLNSKSQVKAILNQLPEDVAKKLQEDDKNVAVAKKILRGTLPVGTNGLSQADAQRIIDEDMSRKKGILQRTAKLSKVISNPNSSSEQKKEATEELKVQIEKIAERRRNLKGRI